jgi:hypothetical protein
MKSLLKRTGKATRFENWMKVKGAPWRITILRDIGGSYKAFDEGAKHLKKYIKKDSCYKEALKFCVTGLTVAMPPSNAIGEKGGKPHAIYRMINESIGEWVYLDGTTLKYVRTDLIESNKQVMRQWYYELLKESKDRSTLIMTGLIVGTGIAIAIIVFAATQYLGATYQEFIKLFNLMQPLISQGAAAGA